MSSISILYATGTTLCFPWDLELFGACGKLNNSHRRPTFQYLRFVANRRCQQIGLDALYQGANNPFPWMSEMIDLKKEKNFFETRVTEYQTGGALNWE